MALDRLGNFIMKSLEEKNTRIFYRDKQNVEIYESLPPEDFKEFWMKYITYNVGDKVEITDFKSPLVYALFKSFQPKIDYNETKWDKRKETSKENGKKGGRPKKENKQEEPEVIEEKDDITCGDNLYYPNDKMINDLIADNVETLNTGETRYMIIQELKKRGNSLDDSINIYNDIINNLN